MYSGVKRLFPWVWWPGGEEGTDKLVESTKLQGNLANVTSSNSNCIWIIDINVCLLSRCNNISMREGIDKATSFEGVLCDRARLLWRAMQRLSSPEKYQFVSEAYSAGFFVLLLPLLLIGRYFGKGLIIAKGTIYLGLDCFDQVTKSTILTTSQ